MIVIKVHAFTYGTYGEQLDEPVIVYNFEVSDFHTYYVTDTGTAEKGYAETQFAISVRKSTASQSYSLSGSSCGSMETKVKTKMPDISIFYYFFINKVRSLLSLKEFHFV